jgi:energy-coupling factor transport system ATP-binding protein
MGIALTGVGFTYLPGTPMAREVLADIDIELHGGEILCLMGRTGAGKSTLINIMCGLLQATHGDIALDGESAGSFREGGRALRNAVGILMQSSEKQLFAETVQRDVAFGPRNSGVSGDELQRRTFDAMRAVGLEPDAFASRSPFSLSEGEMRRVALAGVLAMRPGYLLLDEPSSGLDLPGREQLYKVLDDLRSDGAGILLVTHDWDEVELLADRIAVLSDGHITLQGEKEGVITARAELERAGLRPPPVVRVLAELRGRGLELPPYVSTPAAAAAVIAEAIGGSRG